MHERRCGQCIGSQYLDIEQSSLQAAALTIPDRVRVDGGHSLGYGEAHFCHQRLAGRGTVFAILYAPENDMGANALRGYKSFRAQAKTSIRLLVAIWHTGWFRSWMNEVACSIIDMCRSYQAWNETLRPPSTR